MMSLRIGGTEEAIKPTALSMLERKTMKPVQSGRSTMVSLRGLYLVGRSSLTVKVVQRCVIVFDKRCPCHCRDGCAVY